MAKGTTSMARVHCPNCDEKIFLSSNVEVGLRLVCPHCDAELEIVSVEPPGIDWASDWQYYEEEEEAIW